MDTFFGVKLSGKLKPREQFAHLSAVGDSYVKEELDIASKSARLTHNHCSF